MCGIVGMMDWGTASITGNDLAVFMQMLHADAVRGMHGTGVFGVDKEGAMFRIRAGGPPHKLVGSDEFGKFEKFIQQKYVRFLVGHNRYATRGSWTAQHTHPFRSGEIVMVHNGTLDSHNHLPDGKKYEVDSEALCHALNVWGVEKTVPTLKGAWALVWYDGNNRTMNFIRNSERPLWMAKHNKEPFVAFASEGDMLNWLLRRNGVLDFEMAELPADQLVTWKLDKFEKPTMKELKGKAVKQYYDASWQAWENREDSVGKGKLTVEQDRKVIPFPTTPKSSTKGSHTGSATAAGIGSIKSSKRNVDPSKPYWTTSNDIHHIRKGDRVIICPLDYVAIQTDKGQAEGLFQIKGQMDELPDVDFFINVKGLENVRICMDAPHGVSGKVVSILRSMVQAAKFPHHVYLHDPVPEFVESPHSIPRDAEFKPNYVE